MWDFMGFPPEKVVMATAMGGGEPKMLAMPMAILGKAVIQNTTGWWLSPTPLKNDGVRQLG